MNALENLNWTTRTRGKRASVLHNGWELITYSGAEAISGEAPGLLDDEKDDGRLRIAMQARPRGVEQPHIYLTTKNGRDAHICLNNPQPNEVQLSAAVYANGRYLFQRLVDASPNDFLRFLETGILP